MTPDDDPTADFLAEVRAEEPQWRREGPRVAPEAPERPDRWARARAVAPYVQAAALVAWLASGAFGDGN